MQPPVSDTASSSKVSDTSSAASDAASIKKRRVSVKKKKTVEVKAEPVKPELAPVLAETRSPGPYRGKCLYQSRKCENERAIKRNGKPHNLCEEHRYKQNQHQRKFDAKKFSRKRRRDSLSDEDTKVENHSEAGEPPAAKQLRTLTHQEAETRTPSRVATAPTISAIRGKYPPVYVAGSAPTYAPVARLPPIQSPHGIIRPPVATRSSAMAPEAYPRDHVVYSEYSQGFSGQQSPHVSHRPYIQPQVSQVSSGYSHSELVAASIMVQPQSSPSTAPTPRPVYYNTQSPAVGPPRGPAAMTTPRTLPSLLVPSSGALSPSPYHRVSGIVPSSAQRFPQVVVTPVSSVSVSPTRSAVTVLPPLLPFGLRRSPTPISSPSSSKQ
ncbi:putative glyoxylate reductase/hydroxypyruvate reductase [Phytophthora cinnamomi]|uniref:putative glyoxylate reductase/hydroxypyruvate reductase n=1 Tax=Phytophthora cinnamomi TaxID=4785 RepID=UPI003559F861|nr:putative glyoxylate reductase/hydroxypyruvate reductase [Phytophthora cinnamomi]